jgi:hypothetical protein
MRAVARLIVAAPAVFALLAGGAALCGASDAVKHVWVQVAPPRVGIVRALTMAPTCPEVRFDRRAVLMSERAAPDSDFDIRVCEATVPPGTRRIDVAGKRLRPPPIHPRRIAVVGDTGCRLKEGTSLDDGSRPVGTRTTGNSPKSPRRWPPGDPTSSSRSGITSTASRRAPKRCPAARIAPSTAPGCAWRRGKPTISRPPLRCLQRRRSSSCAATTSSASGPGVGSSGFWTLSASVVHGFQ